MLIGIFFSGETNFPYRDRAFVIISSLRKGGTLDKVTLFEGIERGRTETNSPSITIPFSTTSFTFSMLLRKTTVALFILDADKIHPCPTTSPIARQISSILAAYATLTAWRRVSVDKTRVARDPSYLFRKIKTVALAQYNPKITLTTIANFF